MPIPYHVHNFEIPTATTQDMASRVATDKVVTPSVLGSAAIEDISRFATAEQGQKADSAIQKADLHNLAYQDSITIDQINTNGQPASNKFLSGSGWQELLGGNMTEEERKKIANLNIIGWDEWKEGTSKTEALISPAKLAAVISANCSGKMGSGWGWTKFPSGLMIQWGLAVSNNSYYGRISFPTAFTKDCVFIPSIILPWTKYDFVPVVYTDTLYDKNLSQKGFFCRQINGTSGVTPLETWNVAWVAMGF